MSSRRTLRRKIVLPVTVTRHGGQEKQLAHTLDLTENSARLGGLASQLKPGEIIELHRGALKARFQVVWMGEPGGAMAGQAGVRSLEPNKIIWKVDLPADEADCSVPISDLRNSKPPVRKQAEFPGEKRWHPRFDCEGSVAVTSHECTFSINGEVKDISCGGLYAEVNTPLPVGSEVSMKICIEGLYFECAGVVRTSYPLLGMGISFQNLSPASNQKLAAILQKVQATASPQNKGSLEPSQPVAQPQSDVVPAEAAMLARACRMLTHDFESWERSQSSDDVKELRVAISQLQRKLAPQRDPELEDFCSVEARKPEHPIPDFVPHYEQ